MLINLKTPDELEAMRRSARVAAEVLDAVMDAVRPGITTRDLDELAAALIAERGARSAFFGYRGYPGNTCVSVNEQVVHGIPGDRVIRPGDLVSVDVGVVFEGFIGDNARTVILDPVRPELARLLEASEAALEAGMARAVAGNRLSDISHAIQKTAEAAGFSVVRDYVGHGVGRTMHEEPQIPNYGPPGRGPVLRPGMTLALEPMINLGRPETEALSDGWTVLTRDRKPSVHVEHTVAVGKDGPEVLTWRPKKKR